MKGAIVLKGLLENMPGDARSPSRNDRLLRTGDPDCPAVAHRSAGNLLPAQAIPVLYRLGTACLLTTSFPCSVLRRF